MPVKFHYSVHPERFTGKNSANYGEDWLLWGNTQFDSFGLSICEVPWSPILWRDGIRKSENFEAAVVCALDFDDTLEIDKAEELFADYARVIAPTRSHLQEQKPDGKYAHHFRVILFFERYVESLGAYKESMKYYTAKFGSDPKAVDGARMFYPSLCVYSWGQGKKLRIIPEKQRFDKPKKTLTKTLQEINLDFGAFTEGDRNETIFRIACRLCEAGMAELEAIKLCRERTNLPASEVEVTVRSAYKTVRKKQ